MKAPATPTYHSGSDKLTLRNALGCFATGVTVVTARTPDGEPVGLTANSFTSVSLDPPLLLVCPALSAATTKVLLDAEHFAVNVLTGDQVELSHRFATKGTDRFAKTQCETWHHDVPIIRDALANFECKRYSVADGGDHAILVGQVEHVRFADEGDPLLYFRSEYRSLSKE
ncbi:flavin reductase family protein [Altererythrobacter sp.]|uniref:flavin reductase family protein n=1 Tax=Altererythrobacter sp. TaxID=1872480 RepID=UPI001B0F3E87|nr:flavin reductase family protein [Altererythrobacter sp.]MBO6945012.1 flavin reductase family protein [Altererythrobacter sp.]